MPAERAGTLNFSTGKAMSKTNVIELNNSGEPPYTNDMIRRLTILETRIDTIVPTLATKEDFAKVEGSLRTEFHKELHNMTWKLLGGASALVTAVYFIATHTK